jgi:hypothetical protein
MSKCSSNLSRSQSGASLNEGTIAVLIKYRGTLVCCGLKCRDEEQGQMSSGIRLNTRRLWWNLAIVLLCIVLARGKENQAASANYQKALQQVKSGDLKIDFKALRLNCAASRYDCQADPDDTKLLFSLVNSKKFDEALKKVNQTLEKVFVDAELHYIAFIANSESGKKTRQNSTRP